MELDGAAVEASAATAELVTFAEGKLLLAGPESKGMVTVGIAGRSFNAAEDGAGRSVREESSQIQDEDSDAAAAAESVAMSSLASSGAGCSSNSGWVFMANCFSSCSCRNFFWRSTCSRWVLAASQLAFSSDARHSRNTNTTR